MCRRVLLWICCIFVILLFLNYVIEAIPFRFSTSVSAESDFSVLCYNVKCSDKNFKENQVGIAKEIISESPDIVFLCEFNLSESSCLDSLMTQRGKYMRFYRSGANSVFYSKYDIDSIIAIDTGTSSGKFALNNLIHVMTPKGKVTIVGCHLSSSRKDFWGGKKGRAQEVDSIYQRIICEKWPVIVIGDMNDVSGSYAINRLKEAGLKDVWWEKGCSYGATFHGNGLILRIDHMMYDSEKLQPAYVKVIESDLSDHNAVMAGFCLNKHQKKAN